MILRRWTIVASAGCCGLCGAKGLAQRDLADAAGVSQSVVSRAEAGHFDTLSVRVIRRVFAALDVRLDLNARWRAESWTG